MKPDELKNFPEEILDDPRWSGARWRYVGIVKGIVDGDTITVGTIDLGFRHYAYERIRVDGYDAPERFRGGPEEREAGREAWHYLQSLLPLGTRVGLVTARDRKSFDRWVAGVLFMRDGEVRDAASMMIEAGWDKTARP